MPTTTVVPVSSSARGYALDTTWRTLLRDLGVEAADALRRAGLPDDLLERPGGRVPPADYYRLWQAIEAELPGQELAIRLCEVVRSESFSPLLFAVLCSPDFLTAARRIKAYKALVAPMCFEVTDEGDQVTIALTWLDQSSPPPASLVLMELLMCVTLARMGTREPIRPARVTTRTLPESVSAYEDFLGGPLRRARSDRIVLSGGDARLPFLTSNDGLWSTFEPGLRQRLTALEAPASTAARVRAVLLEGIPSGLVTVEAVARRLAVSARTLQRDVSADGTSFQQLLHETRESLARHYLEHTALPVGQVAFLLGFTEVSSFHRAFRGWTGSTPQALRDQRLREPVA